MSIEADAWGKTGVLSFPIDCEAVLMHLNIDMRDDWFFDTLQYKDLLRSPKTVKEIVSTLLLEGNGRYPGGTRNIYDVPKKNLGFRYTLETDFFDRFIYQAICSYLIPFYDPILSPRVLSHRYNKRRSKEKYLFKNRIELWTTFEGVTYTAFGEGQSLLITDVINYFENISIELIRDAFERRLPQIEASGGEKLKIRNAIYTLCDLLQRWAYSEKHGLPQNRDASSFISNVVLDAVDKNMVGRGYDYYRYVDDIRVICEDTHKCHRALADLVAELRSVGMNINSAKTQILTREHGSEEIAKSFPGHDDRTIAIDNMWKSRSRKVIGRSIPYIFDILSECVAKGETQSRQFRFAVNRILKLLDARLFDVGSALSNDLINVLISNLQTHAASADQFCALLARLNLNEDQLNEIVEYLADDSKSIHSWQNYHLWCLLARAEYSSVTAIELAVKRIDEAILSAEAPAIFIYLHCIGRGELLAPFVERFDEKWPYSTRRHFLFATKDLPSEALAPLVTKLDTRTRGTVARAKSYFNERNKPLSERERPRLVNLWDEINPYD